MGKYIKFQFKCGCKKKIWISSRDDLREKKADALVTDCPKCAAKAKRKNKRKNKQ